eukprot:symbB.v1.2.028989.t1/scaffold3111.1/size63350/4
MGACQGVEVTADEEVVMSRERVGSDMEPEGDFETNVPLCKFACGKAVQPGETKRGRKFDTCCRACAMNKGRGMHDATCGGASAAPTNSRKACSGGSRCRDRSVAHLEELAHPLDEDYAIACSVTKDLQPEPLTLRVDWSDADGSGKLSRKELEGSLDMIKRACGDSLGAITDEAWHHLDEDGNGVVNFGEFAAWAGPRLGLELGVAKMLGKSHSLMMACTPCSDAEHHKKCKDCKHKKGLHVAKASSGEVPIPAYWTNQDGEFNELVPLTGSSVKEEFQQLLDKTYRKAYTKDRGKHNPTNPKVPAGFEVLAVKRNENKNSWQEYAFRRGDIMQRSELPEIFADVKTSVAMDDIGGDKANRLLSECNEWYLFHGTNPDAAEAICKSDFKVSRAGSSTGTLYGKGLYFAESVTKADEYAKPNSEGRYAVLLCRVIGGNVNYTDEVTPDPEALVYSCIEGPFDSVCGDREKTRGTYREFVLFDSEDVYVEYVIEYKRKYGK